jgi:VanZ family protein
MVILASLLPATSHAMKALDLLNIDDKIQHFAAYLVLSFLPALHERWSVVLSCLLGSMLMGIGLEFGQLYSDDRYFDTADMAVNVGGLLAGSVLGLPFRNRVRFPLNS